MVLLTALGSLFGVLLVPLFNSKSKIVKEINGHIHVTMISVGVSALLSDAALHLIPTVALYAHRHIRIPTAFYKHVVGTVTA